MECPICRLVSPPGAQRCDCGYNFVAGVDPLAGGRRAARERQSKQQSRAITHDLAWALTGCVVLGVSIAVVNHTPDPWDLAVLVLGATVVPLGIGLVTVKDAVPAAVRGPRRTQAIVSALLGVALTLFGGRLLLGIMGWH